MFRFTKPVLASGGDTASTSVAEVVSGSHVLTVRGCSNTVGLGVGQCIPSGRFSVGGHTWDMVYYPDGLTQSRSEWIAVGLTLIHPNTDVINFKVRLNFSLLDQLGKPAPKYTTPYLTSPCSMPQGQQIVSYRFIKRAELEESACLKDDCFSAKCDVTVTNIRTEQLSMAPPSDMHEQFGRILETGEVADVAFEVSGETFAAHRCLLAARSSALLSSGATTISDMEPRVFKAMLHFIYTDSLPKIDDDESMEMAQHLLAAADRYNLEKLKLICEDILCNSIDTSKVIAALAFAEQHGCLELKKACFQFLASFQNLKAILGTDGFEKLKTTRPNILEELVANVTDMVSSTEPVPAGGETASTIVAQGVSGSHVLTVEGYSHTVGLRMGIPSGTFSVGGHTWQIVCYPDGSAPNCVDWISIYLLLHGPDAADVKVIKCGFSLLDHLGKPVPKYTAACRTITCYAQGHMIEFPEFIKREEFENSPYLKDDCFSIRCDVTVAEGIRTQPSTTELPPPDMAHQFGRILETGEGADVTFEVAGETFAAHRRLLAARSSVFMAQLFGSAKENEATCIQIVDMEAKIFKMMIHFIYTDSLPEVDNDGMAQHLFVAADRYNLERLKLICTNMLCNRISTSTVATKLAFAEQHGCLGLKKACFKYLASSENLKAAAASDGFEHLITIHPNILEELFAQD